MLVYVSQLNTLFSDPLGIVSSQTFLKFTPRLEALGGFVALLHLNSGSTAAVCLSVWSV